MIDVRGTIQIIIKKAAVALMFAAAATMIYADLIDHTVLFRAGITGWLVGATTYVAGRTGITAKVLEMSRQGGFDAGYEDGRQASSSRLVVVPFRSPGLKPALHFGEQDVVGSLREDGS